MRCLLVLLILACTSSIASASIASAFPFNPLPGSVTLAQSNIDTFEPDTFTSGHFVDVYHVEISNLGTHDIGTPIFANFPGSFVNNNAPGNLTFKAGTSLPTFGPNPVAESFFVLPDGFTANDVLGVGTIDDGTGLSSSYVLPGSVSFIDVGATMVVAVISVPTGTPLDSSSFIFNGTSIVPEPSTAFFLTFLGMTGYCLRRSR